MMMKRAIICLMIGMLGACAAETPRTIAVGQPYLEAENTARAAGYVLEDASHLEWMPAPQGFYVTFPNDRILIVFKSGEKVGGIQLVDHASQPKVERSYTTLTEFSLPRYSTQDTPSPDH
jgi:hypothetical protein